MLRKLKKINIFPYYISEQLKERQRTDLDLLSEEVEVTNKVADDDTYDEDEEIDENFGPDAAENPTKIKK